MSHPSEKAKAIVDSFLRDRGEEIEEMHDAFSTKMPRPKSSSPSEPKMPQPAWDNEDDFMDELYKFNRCLDEASRQISLDFDIKNCQWSDVLGKLKEGNDSLAKRMERDETWWSKGGMWLADLSSLSPLLQAIPDELCFLHGGLALVLHLAKTRDATKRNIVNTFEDIISALARSGNAAEHSKDDPQLHRALETLRITLFKTLPPLIRILMPERLRRFAVPFQSTRAERLLDLLRTDARRVEMRARTLNDQHTSEAAMITKEHVEDIHDGVRDLNEQVQEIDAKQQSIKNMVLRALESQDDMYKMLCDVMGRIEYEQSQAGASASMPAFSTRARSPSPTSPVGAAVAEDKLATLQLILDVDDKHASKDMNFVRRQSREFDTKSKSTLAAIVLHRNHQRWTGNPSSDLIYIDGRPERTYDKTSPISYFCAQLAYRNKGGPHTTATLCFFCGQHVAYNDPLIGPRGLMRSLISQVLRVRPQFDLDGLDLTALDGTHESIPFEDLCALFRLLVCQLPPTYTVYCIIDDINRLERDEWHGDYWAVIDMLYEMVADPGPNLRFKVLLTSPARSKWLDGIGSDQRILVQEGGLQMNLRL